MIRSRLFACPVALLMAGGAVAQPGPATDCHQHVFSPAILELPGPSAAGLKPLKSYALEELARCARIAASTAPYLR